MKARYARYHSDEGAIAVLAFAGRRRLHMLTVNPDIRVKSVPLSEERYLVDFDTKRSIKAIARSFREVGARNGITAGAKRLLRAAA